MITPGAKLPKKYGASYASTTNLTGGAAVAIVTPAANVNGLIVHKASIFNYSTTFTYIALLAKSSAPANLADGEIILAGRMLSAFTSAYSCGGGLEDEIFIPAGLGLYVLAAATPTSCFNSALYTLL